MKKEAWRGLALAVLHLARVAVLLSPLWRVVVLLSLHSLRTPALTRNVSRGNRETPQDPYKHGRSLVWHLRHLLHRGTWYHNHGQSRAQVKVPRGTPKDT